tara:strand:+ start:6578 stop:7654 length:1077 start_codon:yes stop_codon:yes gene_type:complete
MGFKCGLIGMPNVGKSSIFNLLTSQKIPASNYPFCTIDPNVAYVKVPDNRLNKLANINKSEKVVNASIEFVDIAGLIKGASKGEGLGNEFLNHINNTDVIAHVVRFFNDDEIIHVKGDLNPSDDFDDINSELVLADISRVEKYINRIEKSRVEQKAKDSIVGELKLLLKHLNDGNFASSFKFSEDLLELNDLMLLTNKPMFVIANVNSQTNQNDLKNFQEKLDREKKLIAIDVKTEQDISELDDEEKEEFLKEMGDSECGLDKIINTGYTLLQLKTFFTSGPKETRAWSAKKDFNARDCSGIIHTDIQKGFIRAETVAYDEYIKHNGEQGSKNGGVWRQEGKDYIVNEGDVIYFRFNV